MFAMDMQLQAIYFGAAEHAAGVRVKQSQTQWQIVMILSGRMRMRVGSAPWKMIEADHALLMVPGSRIELEYPERSTQAWIDLAKPKLHPRQLRFLTSLPAKIPMSACQRKLVEALMDLRRDWAQADARISLHLADASVRLFLAEVDRFQQHDSKSHPAVETVRRFMHSHFADDLSLNDLSDQAGVSPEHLVRLFRRAGFESPMEYLWRERVNRAVELIRCRSERSASAAGSRIPTIFRARSSRSRA
jgi:AraC family transcriptional regulator of arabinose operon